jgi:hypothetical protein
VALHNLVVLGLWLIGMCFGLAYVALWINILESLNSRRSAEDQIPVFNMRWKDHAWWLDQLATHGPFGSHRALLSEYRRQFPESQAPSWFISCFVMPYLSWGACVIMLFRWYP